MSPVDLTAIGPRGFAALIFSAFATGALFGWGLLALVLEVRERRRARALIDAVEPEWTEADDAWLDQWRIRP